MKRVGFLLKVRPDKLQEYKARHAAVWPDMLDALAAPAGTTIRSLRGKNGLLFGYFRDAP